MKSFKQYINEGKHAKQWMKGADSIEAGNYTLVRGSGGSHEIRMNGKKVGDFSLDDSDIWIANVKGIKGQANARSIDDLVAWLKKHKG